MSDSIHPGCCWAYPWVTWKVQCRARGMVRCPWEWRNSTPGTTLGKRGAGAFTIPGSERYSSTLRGDGETGAGQGLACGDGAVLLDKRPK